MFIAEREEADFLFGFQLKKGKKKTAFFMKFVVELDHRKSKLLVVTWCKKSNICFKKKPRMKSELFTRSMKQIYMSLQSFLSLLNIVY